MKKKRQAKAASPQKSGTQQRPFYAPFEDSALSAFSAIPIPLLKTWVGAYFNPEEAIESEKANASMVGVVTNLIFAGVVLAAVSTIITLGMLLFDPSSLRLPPDSQFIFLAMFAIYPIMLVIFGFIGSGVLFVLSKLLGGSGSYMKQTLGFSLAYGGWALLAALPTILSQLPLVGIVFSLAAFAIELFLFYSLYRVVKSVHGISTLRAALAVAVPLALLVLLVAVSAPAMAAA